MSMSEIILRGSTNAPAEGSAGAFYGRQFVFSYVDWLIKFAKVTREAENSKPQLMTKKIHKAGFIYLYKMNANGRWESQYYTTETIARGPDLSPHQISKDEAAIINNGMKAAPTDFPGGKSGTFYSGQYIRSKEEWKRATKIAEAYIGDDHIAKTNVNGFSYWYQVDEEGNWNSMFFTSWTDVLGGETLNQKEG